MAWAKLSIFSNKATNTLGKKKIEWPLPFQSTFLVTLLYFWTVAILQIVVAPLIFRNHYYIDLITPFLIISIILLPIKFSLFLTVLASVVIESYLNCPKGLYFSCYWIIGTVLLAMRKNVSWYSMAPWKFTLIISQTWVFLAEFFYGFITEAFNFTDINYYLGHMFRIVFSMLVGVWFIAKFKCFPVAQEATP